MNVMPQFRQRLTLTTLIIWAILSFILGTSCVFAQTSTQRNSAWQNDYQILSFELYNQLASQVTTSEIKTPSQVFEQIHKLDNSDQSNKAITLAYKYSQLLQDNIFDADVALTHEFLLKYNQLKLARVLRESAREQSSNDTLDVMNYQLAKFYAQTFQWNEAIATLTQINSDLSLTKNEQNYATLLFGISLQHVKKHREALKIYEKITSESAYYQHAQLNSAVAFIRQGWWTDAQIAIDNALDAKVSNNADDLVNRLHVMLGYSQLQNEFYRDARKTLRQVTVDSQYANRALLGIGLAALSQEDFSGALNAFNYIKRKEIVSLSGLEAFLLVPYVQLQMGDYSRAKQNYNQAILYFDQTILKLKNDPNAIKNDNDYNASVISHESLAIESLNYLLYAPIKASSKLRVQSLLNVIESYKLSLTQKRAEQTIEFIKSYISQCEYGLASLYDKN